MATYTYTNPDGTTSEYIIPDTPTTPPADNSGNTDPIGSGGPSGIISPETLGKEVGTIGSTPVYMTPSGDYVDGSGTKIDPTTLTGMVAANPSTPTAESGILDWIAANPGQAAKLGLTAAALLGGGNNTTQNPAQQAAQLYATNKALAHTPINITNLNGTTRSFDPYGSISVAPMAHQQIAYKGNPTGAGLPDAQGLPTTGFQHLASGGTVTSDTIPAYVPQNNPLNLSWIKTPYAAPGYADGGAIDPTPFKTLGTLDPASLQVAKTFLTNVMNLPQQPGGNWADQINADRVSIYNQAKQMGLTDAEVANIINQTGVNVNPINPADISANNMATPPGTESVPQIHGWETAMHLAPLTRDTVPTPSVSPIVPSAPVAAPGTPGGPSPQPIAPNQNVTLNRSQIPFTGDFLHYGEGPEHLFYNVVNPLTQTPGSVWDPSSPQFQPGYHTQSNENLSYVPPTTGPSQSYIPAMTSKIGPGQLPAIPQATPVQYPTATQPAYGTTGAYTPPNRMAEGGSPHGGLSHLNSPRMQGHIRGPGTGQSDEINAKLSNGEYVVDADTVAALGDGSTEAGAKTLDKFREAIRAHKRSAPPTKIPPKAKPPMAYLKGGRT